MWAKSDACGRGCLGWHAPCSSHARCPGMGRLLRNEKWVWKVDSEHHLEKIERAALGTFCAQMERSQAAENGLVSACDERS